MHRRSPVDRRFSPSTWERAGLLDACSGDSKRRTRRKLLPRPHSLICCEVDLKLKNDEKSYLFSRDKCEIQLNRAAAAAASCGLFLPGRSGRARAPGLGSPAALLRKNAALTSRRCQISMNKIQITW